MDSVITYVTTLAFLVFFCMIGFSFSTFKGASGVSGIGVGTFILYTVVLSCLAHLHTNLDLYNRVT